MLTSRAVGRFEVREPLGRGAIGDVYLAWDPERASLVALKLVETATADPDMLEAERSGISLQEQLSAVAPQVAAVYDHGILDRYFYVVMEYVEGIDLSKLLGEGPLPEPRAADIARQLCDLLEISHSFRAEVDGQTVVGIVHGDIKPENIRLQGDRVRILDFGIAKRLSQARGFTRNLFGSPPFTPPERLERGVVDGRSDLWAAGVVLYAMVAGHLPYAGPPEEVERAIRTGQPPAPLPDGVSPRLKKILYKSLAFEPERRYQTAGELRADLDAWRRGEPLAGEVPEVDPHLTRRTGQPLADPAATRRTERPAGPSGEPTRRTGAEAAAPAAAITERTAAPLATSRWRLLGVRDVVIALSLIALSSQAWVRGEARQIQRDLAVTQNPDLDAEWTRFQRADRFSLPLLGGLGGVRDELKESLGTAADRVIQSYHGDDASTAEGQWQAAQRHLAAAVQLDYGDKKNRAKMVYCQGQIDRIESERRRRQGNRDEAQKHLGAAVEAFDRAARFDSSWPDPYLGLARIYAYDQFDLDKLQAATDQLSRRGYPRGRRETAMLADGHRRRGVELQGQAAGLPPERAAEVLADARYHLQRAVDLYDQIPGYGSVQKNRDDAETRLKAVEESWSAIERSR